MWIRLIAIASILTFLTFSCQKEDIIWDKELDLDFDTTSLLFSAKYVSNIDTQLTIQLDIVTLNGLHSETNYTNDQYYDSVRSYENHTFDISSTSKNKFSPTSYTSLFLFDQNISWWHNTEKTGFYFRRYFEMVSNTPTSKVGLASFSLDPNIATQFYSETVNSYFDNSWEYNTSSFYDITNLDDHETENPMRQDLVLQRLDETIDHLLAANGKQGDLSITFFSQGNFIEDTNDKLMIDNLIIKANTNQIRLNLVGFDYEHESEVRRLALETGGFIGSTKLGYQTVSPIYDFTKVISNSIVILENLDLLLSRKVTSHRCNLVVTINAGQGNFISGTTESIQVNYNNNLYTIQVTIP